MRNSFLITAFLNISLLLQACEKKDEIAGFDMEYFSECNGSQVIDSAFIANKLIGTWKWEKFYSEKSGIKNADKNVEVTFSPNSTFSVMENGQLLVEGTTALSKDSYGAYGFDVNIHCVYLYGRIYICDNLALFNLSYIDGGDHLFKRIQNHPKAL